MTKPVEGRDSQCSAQDVRRVVAHSAVATVESCSCGVVHLHLGPVSLRFTHSSLQMLQRTLSEACEALVPEAPEPALNWAGSVSPRGVA